MTRYRKLKIGVLVFLIGSPLLVPQVYPWTAINVRHQDINIKTGQVRFSRYIWFIRVYRTVEDTPISTTLAGRAVDVAPIEPWQRVNTLSPGVPNSPHYLFHGALYQARAVGSIFRVGDIPPASRTEIATSVLTLWQTNGSGFAADRYIHDLKLKAMDARTID